MKNVFTFRRESDKLVAVLKNGQWVGWLDYTRHRSATGLERPVWYDWRGTIEGMEVAGTLPKIKAKLNGR